MDEDDLPPVVDHPIFLLVGCAVVWIAVLLLLWLWSLIG
jgi:hypothetical protein